MTTNNSHVTAQILKFIGITLIVFAILNYIFLVLPPVKPSNIDPTQWQLQTLQWQQLVTAELIERAVLPLIGLGILFTGFWINRHSEASNRSVGEDFLKLGGIILAGILGLIFLLPVPIFNVNSINQINDQKAQEINKQASQAEESIKQQSQQFTSLLQDPQKLKQLEDTAKSGKIQGEQLLQLQVLLQRLQQFKDNPQGLQAEADKARQEIRQRKEQLQADSQNEIRKSLFKNVPRSLVVSFGYLAIAWLGFTSLGSPRTGRRKSELY